jgi:hypothetical protein
MRPEALRDIKGAMGEERFAGGEKLQRLRESIKREGYRDDSPILIAVREDGTPFVLEGNTRIQEAIESGRSGIQVELRYLRGAEDVDGPLSPDKLPSMLDLGPKLTDDLPMDEASRMARAREMGFDPENIIYHGTDPRNKITAFDSSRIGSANDTGHYGRGHYFADSPGEAKYYGDSVGEYLTNAKLLDLGNTSGDFTSVGHFKDFAPKLDAIGALDPSQKQSLTSLRALEKYLDANIEYLPAQNRDGTDGWHARVKNPAPGYTDNIEMNLGPRGFAESKEAAKESLKHKLIYEMDAFHKDVFPGVADHHVSLSDYVRTDLGSQQLTDAAKKAGYEGIKFGDETVVFDPKNIRSTKAKFDPSKKDSANILAGVGGGLLATGGAGLLGAGAYGQQEQ